MLRLPCALLALLVVLPSPAAAHQGCVDAPAKLTVCVTVATEADAIVSLAVADDVQPRAAAAVASYAIAVDGRAVQELLVFPGTGRRDYSAIVGPLAPGVHAIALQPSAFWHSPPPQARDVRVRVVRDTDPDALVVRHAPALWARADTIGSASDALLAIYAEHARASDGSTTVTYSTIFSNEDGGTSTPALMARWGRTTDIEWTYRVHLKGSDVARAEYQGANHDTLAFEGARMGAHAVLLVATQNNVFADRGQSAVLLRPLPKLVDLSARTRESVMDDEPWMYRVMSRELATEGKLRARDRRAAAAAVGDPREYVFVEGQLTLHDAAAAAAVQDQDGTWRTSHAGRAELTVVRDGFVRVGIDTAGRAPRAVGWSCLPRSDRPNSGEAVEEAGCLIRLTRALRLSDAYLVQPIAIAPAEFRLRPGEMRAVPAGPPR